jgi:integrase
MVFKRARSPYWYYRFMRNGMPVNVSTKQRNKATAEELEAAHRMRLAKGEVGIRDLSEIPTLQTFKDRFTKAIEIRSDAKPETIDFYKRKLKNLLTYPPLARQRIDRIDERLIEKYVHFRRDQIIGKDEQKRNISPAAVNRELATLRRALRLAQEWKIVDRVPKIRMLPGERTRDFVLSLAQEPRYLNACPARLRAFSTLILDTGLRRGEALALEWEDVHVDKGYLQVRGGKSKNAKRTIPLTKRAADLLGKIKNNAVDQYVFSSGEGPYSPDHMDHLHQDVRDTLSFSRDFVIHGLRHTFGTRLGESGADAFTIMKLMGHSSITVSQRYVHPSTDVMERAIKGLEKSCTTGALGDSAGRKKRRKSL